MREWVIIAPIVLSVVAIVVAIVSSRKTSILARKQIESLKELSRLKIESALLLAEEELSKAQIEYEAVLQEMRTGEQQQGNKILDIGAATLCKKNYEDSYAHILQSHRFRIDKLQKKVEELKAKS
ncbi:MAG: hypothetical protein LUF87_00305 [Alistipes sp.]|nr:hypothetical protein [Alistipes sp.]